MDHLTEAQSLDLKPLIIKRNSIANKYYEGAGDMSDLKRQLVIFSHEISIRRKRAELTRLIKQQQQL